MATSGFQELVERTGYLQDMNAYEHDYTLMVLRLIQDGENLGSGV